MILLFSDWVLSKSQGGLLGYQYDNLTRELAVQGDLPEGWTWDILVSASGKGDTWPLALGDGQASITLTDDNLSVRGEYYLQLRGTNGDQVRHTNVITAYNSRSLSGAGQWPTLPTEWIQAEKDIKELNAHPPVPGSNGYWLLWDLSSHSYQESDLPVPVGPAGPPNVLEIGTVETLPADQQATASITGESPAQKLNLGIPQGKQGATGNPGAPGKDGQTPTIQVGEVTASDPGSEPQVKNSGTENAAVFDFVLPTGQTGPTGQAATIEVESTVTGEPGTQASVENVGTTGAAKLRFTIPRGNTGQNGATPTLAAGNVETLEPDQPATASVTGAGPAYQINLGIPRGQTGAQGAPGQDGQDGQTPTITMGAVTTLDPGQDATAEITGETPNLTLNLGIPEGPPGQDGVQLNDNAVNTSEAWSSKKIVDTLCPAFSVSGNPVTCHPVEDYPLSAVVTLKPKQAGSGDPSPENVRPISGYDSVEVNVRGKNFFGGESIEGVIDANKDQLIAGPIIQYPTFITRIKPGETYTVSRKTTGVIRLGVSPEKPYLGITFSNALATTGNKLSITAGENDEWIACNVPYYQDDEVQLELGSTPTAYEPYQGETSTLTLPETIYGGTVDAVSGVGSKTWGFIASYNGESLPGEWISDRDVYASGTTPTTGAQVAYKLATPEPFQATGNQALPAVAGLNTVYTDGDSLAVSGRQDLLYTLQNMQAQTTNLNRFIAEGGTQ